MEYLTKSLKRGTQIAYVPDHVKNAWKETGYHPAVEFGFVNTICSDNKAAFCRYWVQGNPGVLRTIANSERTDLNDIFLHDSVSQEVVDETIAKIDEIY